MLGWHISVYRQTNEWLLIEAWDESYAGIAFGCPDLAALNRFPALAAANAQIGGTDARGAGAR